VAGGGRGQPDTGMVAGHHTVGAGVAGPG